MPRSQSINKVRANAVFSARQRRIADSIAAPPPEDQFSEKHGNETTQRHSIRSHRRQCGDDTVAQLFVTHG